MANIQRFQFSGLHLKLSDLKDAVGKGQNDNIRMICQQLKPRHLKFKEIMRQLCEQGPGSVRVFADNAMIDQMELNTRRDQVILDHKQEVKKLEEAFKKRRLQLMEIPKTSINIYDNQN